MRTTDWISAGFLTWLGHALRLHGSTAAWWTEHGARLVDAVTISACACVLLVTSAFLWRRHIRSMAGANGTPSVTIAVGLLLLTFGGYAVLFVALSLPNRVEDSRTLVPAVPRLPQPVYTDALTAGDFLYLQGFARYDVRFPPVVWTDTQRLLRAERGCLIVNQPNLDLLRERYSVYVSAVAYGVLLKPPAGWHVVERFKSRSNALEFSGIICANR